LQVIGDKQGGTITQDIAFYPSLLDSFKQEINIPIKVIHVTRNPYDNIRTILQKNKSMIQRITQRLKSKENIKSLDAAITAYFFLCKSVAEMKPSIEPNNWLDVRHEDLIENPQSVLKKICDFLEVESPEDYLKDCASIIFESPNKSRYKVNWDDQQIQRVQNGISCFDFLQGYSFED